MDQLDEQCECKERRKGEGPLGSSIQVTTARKNVEKQVAKSDKSEGQRDLLDEGN